MSKNKGGSVINITSLGAHLGFPKNPSYQISKAGVRQLTKSLALDWGKKSVRVNNICPGYIKSRMTMKSYKDLNAKKKRLDRMMLDRWGNQEDIVGAAIFLISDASSYITGSDIYVDGGWTAKGL
jgi:NAD(P)-dependent dehydrogenase (short-subunit alcohol dehydrogenase family)